MKLKHICAQAAFSNFDLGFSTLGILELERWYINAVLDYFYCWKLTMQWKGARRELSTKEN